MQVQVEGGWRWYVGACREEVVVVAVVAVVCS